VLERPFRLDRVALEPPPASTIPAIVAYADLAATARTETEITLRFTSPTFFRQGGRVMPYPAGAPVFLSHLRRWRAFAGFELPGVDPDAIRQRLHLLARPEGEFRPTNLLGQAEQGFVGTARYAIGGDDAFRRGIAILANYAHYCGTGARTAFGMGQTERIG
jgi:CRISPR-associated endoribonuclease Cas6